MQWSISFPFMISLLSLAEFVSALDSGFYTLQNAASPGSCLYINQSMKYKDGSKGYYLTSSDCRGGYWLNNVFYWDNQMSRLSAKQLGDFCMQRYKGKDQLQNLIGMAESTDCVSQKHIHEKQWFFLPKGKGLILRYAFSVWYACMDSKKMDKPANISSNDSCVFNARPAIKVGN